MKTTDDIQNSIMFIEKNITDDLSIANLANQSFFSKTHYQRLFRQIVGEPVMEYIKNRRLQLACRELFKTDETVLDIALKYGYGSHEGFTRAFKSYFGANPKEFRKNKKYYKMGESDMLSNEVMNRISQSAERISAILSNFSTTAEDLSARASKVADEQRANGITVKILSAELGHLAKRVYDFREKNVKTLTVGEVAAFEMSDRIMSILKCIDDITFQMNIIRLLSAVETARMGSLSGIFTPIDDNYGSLCTELVGSKETMNDLIGESVVLLRADIKNEADNCLKQANKLMSELVKETEKVVNTLHNVAKKLENRGKGFMKIANDAAKKAAEIKANADMLNDKEHFSNAVKNIENTSFVFNLHAFNATVESARAGNTKECVTAAEEVKKLAHKIAVTHSQCLDIYNEYIGLINLLTRNDKMTTQEIHSKCIDDIIFQAELLTTQFSLEAERINCNSFRNPAKTAEEALSLLQENKNLSEFCKSAEKISDDLRKVTEEMPAAVSFLIFVSEYENLIARIKKII